MESYNGTVNLFNPTDSQRHEMLKEYLIKTGRPEDFENIVKFLSPPEEITNYASYGKLKGVKVGIIGGGLAGLSSAFELRKLGAEITIFDALEDRIGGRVYTYYFDKDKKYYAELGPMRIPISHETTWHYINKFNLETRFFSQSNPNAFVYVHNTRVRNDREGRNITEKIYPKYNLNEKERNVPWPKLNNYAFNYMIRRLPPRVRAEIIRILPKYSYQYSQLINMSTRQVFEMLGLSQEAINLISSIDPLTGELMYFSYTELAQEMYPLDFAHLYRIEGGNTNLPLAFYKSLISQNPAEYGDMPNYLLGKILFKRGHCVKGIYRSDNNGRVVLRYGNKQTTGDLFEEFDYVICAIPFSTLRSVEIKPLFSNRKMQAIREYNYCDAQKTLFLCNRRFWEEDKEYGRIVGGISNTDLPIGTIIYPSEHLSYNEKVKWSPNEPGVLVASYNFNKDSVRLGNMEEERRIELIKRNVEEVHGLTRGYLDTVVEKYKTVEWDRESHFRGAFAMAYSEQKSIFSYSVLRPEYDNRVFFAGEHTSAIHFWMQGALYSGMLAANMLASQYNK